MNTKEFIESGTLELYALGELSEKDTKAVESLLEQHPEVREELHQIEQAMESFYTQVKEEPTNQSKDALLKKISRDSVPSNRSVRYHWLVAASITLAILSSFAAINFYSKWKATSGQLIALQNDNLKMAEELNQANYKYDALDHKHGIVTNDSFKKITLEGTENTPDSKAVLYWDPDSNELYFSGIAMLELSSDQQYQLWAIIDGKPIDVGVVANETRSDLQKMKGFDGRPSAFAVTVEPAGGSEAPSLETMQVIGNVAT